MITDLYNILLKDVNTTNNIDITELQTSINTLDNDGQKYIYGLIKLHFTQTSDSKSIPYNAKVLKDGRMKIDMNEFPEILIKILWNFVKKHHKKIDDDNLKIKCKF